MVSALMTWRETCPARCQRNSSIPASFVAPGQKDSKVARMRLIINMPGAFGVRLRPQGHRTINKLDNVTLNSYPGAKAQGGPRLHR